MTFTPFDPLEFKSSKASDAAFGSLRREIENILSSYVGWYDPFCELIQNALDAVEARGTLERAAGTADAYRPKVSVIIDLISNSLTISDNGIGLDKEKFEQFLVPNFSFKTGNTRGHKGVGATYVAYGFNYMRISTKVPGFTASGRIVGARTWIKNNAEGGNPKVEPDNSDLVDKWFEAVDRGVSITVRFDESSHPRKLDWIGAGTADQWLNILSIKTGIGSVQDDASIAISIRVIAKPGETIVERQGTRYEWLHHRSGKSASIKEIRTVQKDFFEKHGPDRRLPDKYRNLDFLYETWSSEEIMTLIGNKLDAEEIGVLNAHTPSISVEYGYTTKLWNSYNESLGLRGGGYKVLHTGIQMAANNMPQGEPILVPLRRYAGRQNQVHFLMHFNNYTPDLGRKGFHRELTDFAKSVAQKIIESVIANIHKYMKPNTGSAPDLARELAIGEWKKEMLAHEAGSPLVLRSEHFFLPTERVAISSVPTREQDVIALFHQLIAGGVIRGITAMSTNERFTYDGLYKVSFDLDKAIYTYDANTNPLGVSSEIATSLEGKITDPRVLEYKFSLDGLIEDLDGQDKNIKDIDLCIAWRTGEIYKERYGITSLLVPENVDQRQYHGITHVLFDLQTGNKLCDLIVLSELISSLNDPEIEAIKQREKYE